MGTCGDSGEVCCRLMMCFHVCVSVCKKWLVELEGKWNAVENRALGDCTWVKMGFYVGEGGAVHGRSWGFTWKVRLCCTWVKVKIYVG